MNNPDYKADLRVKCLTDQDEDFTQGGVYECFSISKSGTAKVIDDQRDENYLLVGDFQIVHMHEYADPDINPELTGYSEWNKDCGEYAVWVQFTEKQTFAIFTKKDLLHLIKMLEEGEDR